jgi:hypothetical protein
MASHSRVLPFNVWSTPANKGTAAMIGILAQKGLALFGRSAPQPSPDRDRLIGLLDMLVDECEREAGLIDDATLLPGRYYSLARAAAQGNYRIEPERIAERLLRH